MRGFVVLNEDGTPKPRFPKSLTPIKELSEAQKRVELTVAPYNLASIKRILENETYGSGDRDYWEKVLSEYTKRCETLRGIMDEGKRILS
ncbi:hypothetical protein AKJ59_00620 [candidate division MSBL1 archaeon SCGC-AAA385M02]|uniref:Uncharacterized protein n=1 Tax=candidate division MSBL1 archaeon SCGC-AAA385M02 TaxID=1698287 RepID=A0A133VQG1_9EURY|nr:hypothetical protein AKJ59_00620 [candidate division MSBL1 archaeon SCGC-AAA385M02]